MLCKQMDLLPHLRLLTLEACDPDLNCLQLAPAVFQVNIRCCGDGHAVGCGQAYVGMKKELCRSLSDAVFQLASSS